MSCIGWFVCVSRGMGRLGAGDVRGYGYGVVGTKLLGVGEPEVLSMGFMWSAVGWWMERLIGRTGSVVGMMIDEPGVCTL